MHSPNWQGTRGEAWGSLPPSAPEKSSLWSLFLTLGRISALGGLGGLQVRLDLGHPSQGQDKASRTGRSGLGLHVLTHPSSLLSLD